MKFLMAVLVSIACSFAHAEEKIKMYFKNEDIIKIIEIYSKASGQKFVVDPGVVGIISIFAQDALTHEQAFEQLSLALAVNGYAISKQADTMVVRSARNAQRDLIEVGTEKPKLKPERMFSWVYTAKNLAARDINYQMRNLSSKDGEISVVENSNQLIVTDWTSNLQRIAELFEKIDVKSNSVFGRSPYEKEKKAAKGSKVDKEEKTESKTN